MARRYRKSYSRRRRRGFRRRRTRASKALAAVRSLSRKVAAEVKKADAAALVPQSVFTPLLTDVQSTSTYTLRDYGHLYPVFGNGDVQGIQLDDFIGEQVRAKYLYVGLHLQLPIVQMDAAQRNPVTFRVMIIQDRNYEGAPLNTETMFRAIFGISKNSNLNSTTAYSNAADSTLLPINPQQPGRFKILRDFMMNVAPGWRQDYYKKIYIRQRELLSKGRIYYGETAAEAGQARPPGDETSIKSVARNALYILTLYQAPMDLPVSEGLSEYSLFNYSIQTRFAYYDN